MGLKASLPIVQSGELRGNNEKGLIRDRSSISTHIRPFHDYIGLLFPHGSPDPSRPPLVISQVTRVSSG